MSGPRTTTERPLSLYVAYRALALAWAHAPFQVPFLEAHGFTLSDAFDLNMVFAIATVCFEVPTGLYADRHGRRRSMALGCAVMIVACGLFAFGGHNFALYAAANALFALSMSLASGSDSAWLYDYLVPSAQRDWRRDARLAAQKELEEDGYGRWEGFATAAKGVGNLVAVLAGGVIFAVAPRGVFLLTAVCATAGVVIALQLPEQKPAPRNTSVFGDMRNALRLLAGSPQLMATMGYGALTFVLLRLSLFTDPSHVEAHLAGSTLAAVSIGIGLVTAGKEIAAIAVASRSGWITDRLGPHRVAIALGVLACALYAVMGRGVGPVDVAAMVVLSGAQGVFSPLMKRLVNALVVENDSRATLLSFESMGRRVLFAAVSPLFGRALEASSLHATLGATAWVGLASYLALLGVWVVAVRNARAVPPSALVSRSP